MNVRRYICKLCSNREREVRHYAQPREAPGALSATACSTARSPRSAQRDRKQGSAKRDLIIRFCKNKTVRFTVLTDDGSLLQYKSENFANSAVLFFCLTSPSDSARSHLSSDTHNSKTRYRQLCPLLFSQMSDHTTLFGNIQIFYRYFYHISVQLKTAKKRAKHGEPQHLSQPNAVEIFSHTSTAVKIFQKLFILLMKQLHSGNNCD
jgi:hypothetical protein